MHKIVAIIFFVFISFIGMAQFKHYFSYNGIPYADMYNKENDKSYFPENLLTPSLSYKIEKNKIGIEIFLNNDFFGPYHPKVSPEYIKSGDIQQIVYSNLGIACHYSVFNKKYLKINPFAGAVKNWYDATILEMFIPKGSWNEVFFRKEKESKIGLLLGTNINVPIWKGVYANTNARYIVFPTGQYNKQNMIFEVGVGYMYQHKPKREK